MAGVWTTLNVKDAAGTTRTMRAWDESGVGTGPYSFGQVLADGLGTALAKVEDVAAASGDLGLVPLAVRRDTAASSSGTDGDYSTLNVDSTGKLWVTGSISITASATAIAKAEDVASADADVGVPAMAVRKATPANTSGTDGDYEFLQISAGKLWTTAAIDQTTDGTTNKVRAILHDGTTAALVKAASSGAAALSDPAVVVTLRDINPNGSAVSASSAPVVIASDQAAIAVSFAAGATSAAKAEDVASANADVGIPAMAIRKATPANTSNTDGDYEMLQISAGRLWASATIDTALPAGTALVGKVGIDQTTPGTTNGVQVNAALPAGTNAIGTVSITNISNGEYETVAASQTAQVLGATGATGDYISGLLVIPATTSPGNVLLLDNATSITVFTGGTTSVSNLVPFFIPLGMISVSGAWKVTSGANVSVIGIGNFT